LISQPRPVSVTTGFTRERHQNDYAELVIDWWQRADDVTRAG
jgi:hypothetical protein